MFSIHIITSHNTNKLGKKYPHGRFVYRIRRNLSFSLNVFLGFFKRKITKVSNTVKRYLPFDDSSF